MSHVIYIYLYFIRILFINVVMFLGYSSLEGWVGEMPLLDVRIGAPSCSLFVLVVHRLYRSLSYPIYIGGMD